MKIARFLCLTFTLLLTVSPAAYSDTIVDNFESYATGTFPFPTWNDVAAFSQGAAPIPSATVIDTTDAFGNPTKALSTVNALGDSKGIYAQVGVSNFYTLLGDMRIDQYSDHPEFTTEDWAMQITFGQAGPDSWAVTPQAGLYASSLTQGWRLFMIPSQPGGPFLDVDIGVAANVGQWYRVLFELDAVGGVFHSRIEDILTGIVLADRLDVIPDWQQQFAVFDSVSFFAGDLNPNDTIPNIGVVDNVNVRAEPVPEPSSLTLFGIAAAVSLALRRRANRQGE